MARVRRRGKKYVLDYRLNGERPRVTFDSREEAEELCAQYNDLKRAKKLDQFAQLLAAREALARTQASLSGKSLRDAISEYGATCSKLKSYQTQKNEKSDFKALFKFLSGEKKVRCLFEVTPQMLEEYQGRLRAIVSNSTCNRRFNGFNHFFEKCVEWGYLEKSPARFIKKLKEVATPRKTFTDDEIERTAKKLKPYLRAPFLFSAYQGVRPGEWSSSRVCDWNPKEMTLVVYSGKNAQTARILHLHPDANAIIDQTISDRINVKAGDFIFQNLRGKQLKPKLLTEAVRDARRELGIEEGKTPYGLRHTFATKCVRQNVASALTKKLMGHSSIRTTENYYKLEDKDLKVTVEQLAKVFDFGTGKEVETVTNSHKVG